MNSLPILVADDQLAVREAMRLLLKAEGYEAVLVESAGAVLHTVRERDFGVVLMDLNYTRDTTSGQEGLDLLTQIRRLEAPPPVVVMTAWATIDVAVEAMRLGAKDFIAKPWENARVLATVRTQLELLQTRRRSIRLESELLVARQESANLPAPTAHSPAMLAMLDVITRVGPSEANVLIVGENGTGKSLAAKLLHRASARAQLPLVTVNMGGINENLFESELFGHVKGAFTDAKSDRIGRFEMADQSTLFLDEIGNLPLSQQAKLLRTIETGEFERVGSSKNLRANVRILAATNSDLAGQVEAGQFRRDLYFRLNTVELKVPALRDRREDILPLAQEFLERFRLRYHKNITGFDASAERTLQAHLWPGNVRELEHAVERAVLLTAGPTISANDLAVQSTTLPGKVALDEMSLEEVERYLVERTLARFAGNAGKAAAALGLSRATFYRRLQAYGL